MAAAVYAPLDVELAGYGFKTVDAMEEMQRCDGNGAIELNSNHELEQCEHCIG